MGLCSDEYIAYLSDSIQDMISADTSRIVGGRHLYDQVVMTSNVSEVIVMKGPDGIIESRTGLRTMVSVGTVATILLLAPLGAGSVAGEAVGAALPDDSIEVGGRMNARECGFQGDVCEGCAVK